LSSLFCAKFPVALCMIWTFLWQGTVQMEQLHLTLWCTLQ